MKRVAIVLAAVAMSVLAMRASFAEEAFHKFRVSLTIANESTADGLRTNADNTSLFRNPFGGVTVINDPRPDSATKNENKIKDDYKVEAQASYGILKWKWAELTLDSSIGYFKGRLGDLEVAGEFSVVDPPRIPCGESSRYHLSYVPIGEVKEIPVRLGATMRFRPRASGGPFKGMSPFVSAGIGYMFVDIEASQEFLDFSLNVAKSTGFYNKPDPANPGRSTQAGSIHQFKAAEASTPDTFEYHAAAGLEFPVRKGLFVIFTAGWMWASKEVDITIDGRHSFGTATPNGFSDIKYPIRGLPVTFLTGGLVDYGSGRPTAREGEPCKFKIGDKDGKPDLGTYYAQGGTLGYSGSTVGLGLRYQF